MKKSKNILMVLTLCLVCAPAFAATGIFDKTADWTLATSKNKVPGSITVTGSDDAAVYTVKGNGDDMWGTADEGFFAYKSMTGSFSIQAKVTWVNPGDNWGTNAATYEWAKVGIMIRDKADDAGSRHFALDQKAGSATPAELLTLQKRQISNGDSLNFDIAESYPEGVWLRISRYAPLNFFWAEYSVDGKTWTLINSNTAIPMGDEVAVGICIANHSDDTTLAEATASDVKITPLTSVPTNVIKPAIGALDGHLDIGNLVNGNLGDVKYDAATKTYNVSGSGDDIWNTADAFHFAYKKMTGAFEAEAEYQIMTIGEATWTKAGLMVRDSLGTSAANVFALVRSDNQFAVCGRALFGSGSTESPYKANTDNFANRFKVVRVGNTVSGFMWSDTDEKWVLHSSKPFTGNNENFVGLAVTAHDNTLIADADFSNVKFAELPFDIFSSSSKPNVVQGESVDITYNVKIRDGVTSGFTIAQDYSPSAVISNVKSTAGTATTDNQGKITWTGTGLTGTVTLTYTLSASETEKGTFTINTTYDDGKGFSGSIYPLSIGVETAKPLVLDFFAGYTEIGTTNKGKVLHDNKDWSVIGSGADIWGTADGFEFLYLGASGDFTFSIENAKIGGYGSNPSSDGWQKMGIMARQDLTAGSANAIAEIRQSDQAYMLQWRLSAGIDSINGGDSLTTATADHGGRLMLKREGNIFSAYYINTAGEEVYQSEIEVEMTDPIYVGIATTAHSNGAFSAGTFSNPKFTGKSVPVTPPGVEAWMMF